MLNKIKIGGVAWPFDVRYSPYSQVLLRLFRAVAGGIILHPDEVLVSICIKEGLYIIQDYSVVLIRVHTPPLLLPERSWPLPSHYNRTMEHPSRELPILVLYTLRIKAIGAVLL